MTDPAVRAALQSAAQALQTSAQAHKSEEFRHRKRARALHRELEKIRSVCAAYGIELQLDTAREAQSQ